MRIKYTPRFTKAESSFTRIGLTSFAFFLCKGLPWLLTPMLFAYLR